MNSLKSAVLILGSSALLFALIGSLALAVVQEPPSDVEYQRLFAPRGKLVQPAETLRILRKISESLMRSQTIGMKLDHIWAPRLEQINTLMEHSNIVGCRNEMGWKLGRSIDKYDYPKQEFPTIMAYLEQCRSDLFAACNLYLDRRAVEALAQFAKVQSSKLIENFRKFLPKYAYDLPQPTFAHNIPGPLLMFMNEQLEEPLNSNMRKLDFGEIFNRTLRTMCTDIKAGSEFLAGFDVLFTSSSECKEMEEELRDLHRMNVVCASIADNSAEMSDFLYEYLVSKATQVTWRNG